MHLSVAVKQHRLISLSKIHMCRWGLLGIFGSSVDMKQCKSKCAVYIFVAVAISLLQYTNSKIQFRGS